MNPKVVQERLGHESVKTTLDLYGHVLPTAQRDAATLTGSGQTTLRLLPHVHGTDGYFLASLRKKE